jgi:hypothetical protein
MSRKVTAAILLAALVIVAAEKIAIYRTTRHQDRASVGNVWKQPIP